MIEETDPRIRNIGRLRARSYLSPHQSCGSLEGTSSWSLLFIISVSLLSLSYAICYMGIKHALFTPDSLLGGLN